MSIGRSFWTLTRYARAARFWLFLVLAALAFFGCNEARAQVGVEPCTSGTATCDRAQAHAACMAHIPLAEAWYQANTNDELRNGTCVHSGTDTNGSYQVHAQIFRRTGSNAGNYQGMYYSYSFMHVGCPLGSAWNPLTNQCGEDCAAKPDRQWNPGVGLLNGSTTCDNGCQGVVFNNEGGSGFTVTYGGGLQCNPPFPQGCDQAQLNLGWRNSTVISGVCVPPTQECADGVGRDPTTGECGEDACPAGMSLNPQGQCEPQDETCPAGQTRAPDGSCQNDQDNCPAGQVKGPDGTCKPDGNGDGEPDDEVPDSFSGGDSCEAPPTCSGDVIMCGIARINWRIDCNTRKDTKVNGGACNAIPICVGRNCDALEYAQLLQQWRASCALERLVEDGVGGGDGGEDGEEGPQSCGPGKSDAECEAGQNIGDTGDAGSVMQENDWLASGFDTAGFGWSQSCPAIPSVTVFGTTVDFQSKLGPLCEWFQLGGIFLMITTAITCLVLLIKV